MRRELTQEEKSLALLARIDFGQESKKAKTEDGTEEKEEEAVQVWPWQGLVEHLNQAHQELIVILDLINHVRPFQFLTSFVTIWTGYFKNCVALLSKNISYQAEVDIETFTLQVEESEAVTVARMERPKLLQHETCSDLALRASSKLHHFRVSQ